MQQIEILIVEDEPADRVILRRNLQLSEPARYSFTECSSGREAVERVATSTPDCILLDFNLPDTDGIGVVERLRTRGQLPCAIVILTAAGQESLAVKLADLGVMDYLIKGASTPESLRFAIASAIQRFRLRAELETQRRALESQNHELKQARAEITRERERYKLLSEAIPQLVWIADEQGTIEHANKQLTRFAHGRVPDGAWQLRDLVAPHCRDSFDEVWRNVVQQQSRMETQVPLQADGAAHRAHLARALPIRDDSGRLRWFGTLTDVEDQRKAEEALRERAKSDSIGLLAGGIAHDFNNLLVGILGGASYARQLIPDEHDAVEMLDLIVRSAERAAQLTQQLLAYAGKTNSVPERTDVPQLVRDTCGLVSASIPKKVSMNVEVGAIPAIETNVSQLQQVVMNLVMNAAEAIEREDGSISVSVRVASVSPGENPANRLGYQIEPGEYLDIKVTDNGVGMDANTLMLIFDPFFTTKFTGRGLGLSAVQGIVRSQRGLIDVESKPGHGSTFRVLLPAPPAAASRKPALTAAPLEGPRTILFIDDEEVVLKTGALILSRSGYKVLKASNGQEGLHLLNDNKDNIDLILLDMNMPGMSGKQVLSEVRLVAPDLPVLITSGYTEEELTEEHGELPIAGFVRKPFTIGTLLSVVSGVANGLTSRSAVVTL